MTTTAAPADNVADHMESESASKRKMYSAEKCSNIVNLTNRKFDPFCRFSHFRFRFFLI